MSAHRVVKVINLGRMGYLSAYNVQMHYAKQHLDRMARYGESAGDVLILVEHKPVYTVGIRRDRYSREEEATLKSFGAEFYRTNRGGLITFHGPGQLVAYPILNLKNFNRSMKWYVSTLEKTLIRTCEEYDITATVTKDIGVWVNDRKIGAIGVHSSRNITTHGMCLNCSVDLGWYKHIVACGLEGKEVTSLSKETGKKVTIFDAVPAFVDAFSIEFECDVEDTLLEEDDKDILKRLWSRNIDQVTKQQISKV